MNSKCCNSTITIYDFVSLCDKCGASVNPDNGEPFINSDTGKPYRKMY